MALLDGQWSYRNLVFGEGTDYQINRIEGFEGADIRVSDSDQPRNDGALRGLDYVSPRLISAELSLIETEDLDGSVYEQRWATVRETFRPSRTVDFDLTFKRPGQAERFIKCRPVQLIRVEEYKRYNRFGSPPVTLRAADPRIYSADLHLGNVPVFSSTGGGMEFPIVEFPVDMSAGLQVEFATSNGGTADAYPLIRFHGPVTGTCTGVTLTNTTTGQVLQVTADILTGQILTCDMEAAVTGANRLVIALDGTTRYGAWALPRDPFRLVPGSNTLRFDVTGSSTNVVCLLNHRDTWLG